ncbi:hypothetical protein LTR94_036848, partial [Friedmanniomyces endolithicus]
RGQASGLRGPRPLLRRRALRQGPDRVAELQGIRRRTGQADQPEPRHGPRLPRRCADAGRHHLLQRRRQRRDDGQLDPVQLSRHGRR